jgi:hypothetical protein
MARKIKSIGIMFLLYFLAVNTFAEPPQDVDGWSKVKWGMTEDEVSASFPGQVHPFKNQYSIGCMSAIDSTEILGYEFRIVFTYDCESKRLKKVSMGPVNQLARVQALGVFEKLTEELQVKYGKPGKSKGDKTSATNTWIFPSTKIELWLIAVDAGPALLTVTYEQREKEDML